VAMVFWHQDIYSEAIGATARRRLPAGGGLVAWLAERLERRIARRSAAIVAISPTFLDRLAGWGVADKATVVPNWAPLDELPECATDNEWRDRAGLRGCRVVLYSGTLGLKHDPGILALLAERLRVSHPDARVVVISEGKGREWLERWRRNQGPDGDNLVLLDFQPYSDLPAVMGAADVLVAVLEPDASRFSVPSKVLTYLCSGRPIVGVLPPDNSVAEILTTRGAGLVVSRPDVAAEVARLLDDDAGRRAMGRAGRRYAEETFSPETAADRFIDAFGALVRPPTAGSEPDGQPGIRRRPPSDLDMSWPGGQSTGHGSSSGGAGETTDDKVAAVGPFPHHVG
jgi:colanic acid biosynthesis glycosyl transferase WcaI